MGLILRTLRWETEAHPGFHVDGPQGLIDSILKIEDCDILIGIFWKKFGTPIKKDGQTGTEHEFYKAYDAWKQNKRPQIMLYFSQQECFPKNVQEVEQLTAVLKFKANIPKEGLSWQYSGLDQFKDILEDHLTKYVNHKAKTDKKNKPTSEITLEPNGDFTSRYLKDLTSLRSTRINNLDDKSLEQCYVPHETVLVDGSTWELDDETILKMNPNTVPILSLITEFLNDDKLWIRVVAGVKYVGKTTMSKMIASHYAENCCGSKDDNWMPFRIDLKNGLENAFGQHGLKHLLKETHPNQNYHQNKILLILDGLEDYEGTTNALIKSLTDLRDTYRSLKAILITGIINDEWINDNIIEANHGKYIRLLSFSRDKVKKYLMKYGLQEQRLDDSLPEEGLTVPILAWHIVSFDNCIPINTIRERWTNNMLKSCVLMHRFYSEANLNPKSNHIKERRCLRYISYLDQISGNELESDIVRQIFNKEGLPEYPVFLYSSHRLKLTEKGSLEFGLIREYLLAEYLLQNILEGKIIHIHVKPTQETVQFIDGLIDLLKTDHSTLHKFLFEGNSSLVYSFYFDIKSKNGLWKKNDMLEKLKTNAVKAVNNKKIVSVSQNHIESLAHQCLVSDLTETYESLWMYRWISLFVFNKLDLEKDEKNQLLDLNGVIELIQQSSNIVPYYLKFLRTINISHANFEGINFSYADLTESDLRRCNLRGSNLSNTHLSNADLTAADLSRADLSRAHLKSASLNYTNLQNANLEDIDLENAYMIGTELSNATTVNGNLKIAKISNAVLFNTDLSSSNLKDAEIYDSILSGADLSGTDLGGTKFQGSVLLGADLSNSTLHDTNFSGSNILYTNFSGTCIYDEIKKSIDDRKAYDLGINLQETIRTSNNEIDKSIDNYCRAMLLLNFGLHRSGIRFIGVFDPAACEFKVSYHKQGIKLLLSQREKTMMLQISWIASKQRKDIEPKVGKLIYSFEEYEKLKRIVFPLNDKPNLLLVTAENDFNPEMLLGKIPSGFLRYGSQIASAGPSNNRHNDASSQEGFCVRKNLRKYNLCEKIVKLEGARIASICDNHGEVQARCTSNPDLQPLLTSSESNESTRAIAKRWMFQKKFVSKVGRVDYALAIYEKIKRITFPLKDDLLIVTFDNNVKDKDIRDNIILTTSQF